MENTAVRVFHRVLPSKKSFEEVTDAVEAQLGHISQEQRSEILETSATIDQYAATFEPLIGASGFIVFWEANHSDWMSKLLKPLKAKMYVLGNPLLAKDFLIHEAAFALYVPTRLCIYEDAQGATQLAYDTLGSFAALFDDPALIAAAEVVDQKLDALVTLAAG